MSFSADLSKFCHKEAPEKTNKIVRGIVIEIANRLISRSPVGDPSKWQRPGSAPAGYVGGHFRHNWQYGFGAAPSSELDGIENDANGKIKAAVSSAGGVHWIVNNTPYAERIETGWSQSQAPQGVVGLTELEFPQIVREVIG